MSRHPHLTSYWSEAKFIISRSLDLGSCARLLWRTAQYHLLNRFPGRWRSTEFQAEVRLPGGPAALTLRSVTGDLFILHEIMVFETYQLPKSVVDPDSVGVIFDCGANIGMASLYLADRYPQATIYSIEPHPDNYRLLCANTRTRRNIRPIHGCICGENPGTRFLSMDRPAWGNTLVPEGSGMEVPAFTIDSLMQAHGVARVDLLKVDIEGTEREVFAHPQFLANVGLIIIELHGDYDCWKFKNDVGPMGFYVRYPHPGDPFKMIIATREKTADAL